MHNCFIIYDCSNNTSNFLHHFSESEFTGEILINKQHRDLKRFRRQSAYIMQAHDLQPHLTVLEAMHFSANLKIGTELSPASKKIRVRRGSLSVVKNMIA